MIGPTELGAYDQDWFWVTTPDNALVTYECEGTEYETTEFWLRPDATGPGSFEVRVLVDDSEVVREIEFVSVERPEEERACHLLTVGEMLDLLDVELLQRFQPVVGANLCDWMYTAPTGRERWGSHGITASQARPVSSDSPPSEAHPPSRPPSPMWCIGARSTGWSA